MGDPLSVAASVAGLLSLGLQTIDYLCTFYRAYRDRDPDLARLVERLGNLSATLQTIDDVLRQRRWKIDEESILRNIEHSINQCEDVVKELDVVASKFRQEPNEWLINSLMLVGRRAAYPFRRSTIEKLDEDTDSLRDDLSVALQALQLQNDQIQQNGIDEIRQVVEDIRAQNVDAGILEWLKAPDATVNFNVASVKCHPGTGRWFVQGHDFTSWLRQENSFLWLYGFAGCGKSVLCSTAIHHTFRHQRSSTLNAVAFFFFAFDDESKQDASALLRAILLQLSSQLPVLQKDLARLQQSCMHGCPPVCTLLEYVRQAITRSSHTYILLDALDESPAENRRDGVLQAITAMRQWQLPGLHLLVTSRDIPDIRDHIQATVSTSSQAFIPIKNEDVRQDIFSYVSHVVDHDPQLRTWGHHRQRIKEYLAEHADGVFRWVDCQLTPLRRCGRSVKRLENCLQSLPQTLDQTYERMLSDIGAESQQDARRILSLLCFSSRPLSVEEVIDAIAVDIDEFEGYDSDRKLGDVDDLLRTCPGLIETFSFESGPLKERFSHSGGQSCSTVQLVRIAHFSVQEYLLSERIKHGHAANFALAYVREHQLISKNCLLYLRNEDLWKHSYPTVDLWADPNHIQHLVKRYPFAVYAAHYWHHHYHHADREFTASWSSNLISLFTVFGLFDHWKRLIFVSLDWDLDTDIFSGFLRNTSPGFLRNSIPGFLRSTSLGFLRNSLPGFFRNTSPACYAAFLGIDREFPDIFSASLLKSDDVKKCFSDALLAASYGGQPEIVKYLVLNADVGANVQEYLGHALVAGSLTGREEVVKVLLNHKANPNFNHNPMLPLDAAAINGHSGTAQLLLDAGANVNALGRWNDSALIIASQSRHVQTVKLLLEAGADVDIQNEAGANALHRAIEARAHGVIDLLLDAGVDLNAKDNSGDSAIDVARKKQCFYTAKRLRERGMKQTWEDVVSSELEQSCCVM